MLQPIILTSFTGSASAVDPRLLPDGVGVTSSNQQPRGKGDGRPWNAPATVSGVTLGAGRKTIYRLGRDTQSTSQYWLSWTTVVHAIRSFDATDTTERTYFTGSGSPKWTNNIIGLASAPYPAATRELSVPQPTVAPTATLTTDGPDGTAGAQFYVYTWVNDLGWESAPSPASNTLTVKPGAIVGLAPNGTVPAGNYGITTVRWYRSQIDSAGSVELMFLRDYAVGASGQSDDARAVTEAIPSTTWLPLDAAASNLTECWAQFAAATVGKTVRFNEPGFIYAWPLAYEYILANTPVAAVAFQQRLMVLTSAGAEVFTGIDPGAMDQQPVSVPPCVAQRSVVGTDTGAFWASNDGICYYGVDGSRNLTAGAIKPEDWAANYSPATAVGAMWKGFYVCFLGSNAAGIGGLMIDPANPAGVYPIATAYAAAYHDPLLRELFVVDGSTLKQWHPAVGTPQTWTFTSKVYRQAVSEEPEWLEVLADGTVTVTVYVDSVLVFDRAVTSGRYRFKDGVQGRDIQIGVSSNAPVKLAMVE